MLKNQDTKRQKNRNNIGITAHVDVPFAPKKSNQSGNKPSVFEEKVVAKTLTPQML